MLAVRDVVDDYLTAQGVNDCNLLRAPVGPAGVMSQTFSASGNGCPATFSFTVEPADSTSTGPGDIHPLFTRVSISYPYSFSFGRVAGLVKGSGPVGSRQLITNAIEPNMD